MDEGDAVADWLSTFLKQRVRLVKYGGELSHGTALSRLAAVLVCCSSKAGFRHSF